MIVNYEDKKILDPKNDVVFQKIFGSPENEDILLSFLNALLENTDKENIEKIEYVDTKLSDIDAIDDKIGILDVRVITDRGFHINVEIQLINRYNMINRTLFYWSRLYSSQIKKGENYKNLSRTITINILNFSYINSLKFHSVYHLWEDEEKKMLTNLLEIHFVELPKFLDESPKLDNNLNKWLAFLTKTPEKEVREMEESSIKRAITVLDMLSSDPETVRLAELRMKKILDERSMLEGAREEAMAAGRAEGLAEGKMEEKEKVAINLLKLGISEEIISEGTGLSIDEIKNIKAQSKL